MGPAGEGVTVGHSGRIHMSMPTFRPMQVRAAPQRNKHKHWRLFEPGPHSLKVIICGLCGNPCVWAVCLVACGTLMRLHFHAELWLCDRGCTV